MGAGRSAGEWGAGGEGGGGGHGGRGGGGAGGEGEAFERMSTILFYLCPLIDVTDHKCD